MLYILSLLAIAGPAWTWFLVRRNPENTAFLRIEQAAKASGNVADELVKLLKQHDAAHQAERWTLISTLLAARGVKVKAAPLADMPLFHQESIGPVLSQRQDLARFNGEQKPETHIDPGEV